MDYMSLENDDFNAWYSQLYKQEYQEFLKAIFLNELFKDINKHIKNYKDGIYHK